MALAAVSGPNGAAVVVLPPGYNPMFAVLEAAAEQQPVWGAALTAALFLLAFLFSTGNLVTTRFKTYILLTASLLLRGVGFALDAASVSSYNSSLSAAFMALWAAGFGMAIGVGCLVLTSWYKNAADWAKPGGWFAGAAVAASRASIPLVIIFGPVLGAVAAGLIYGGGTSSDFNTANTIRKVSAWGFLATSTLVMALSCVACATVMRGLRRVAPAHGNDPPSGRNPHTLIFIMPLAVACLVVAAAQRVAATFDPRFSVDPVLLYCMAVLPELLNACLMAVPFLLGRTAMSERWGEHLRGAGVGEGVAARLTGGDGEAAPGAAAAAAAAAAKAEAV